MKIHVDPGRTTNEGTTSTKAVKTLGKAAQLATAPDATQTIYLTEGACRPPLFFKDSIIATVDASVQCAQGVHIVRR